jgi:class 3 adenylate cyclase
MTTLDPRLSALLANYLPRHLFNRLPETEALREAINHLNGLIKAVKSFLPAYLADDEATLADDYAALRPGAFLFADVSGFTALSEKIQQRAGSEGAETLTAVIIDYFSTMLEILANSNGQLLKFAGDALLAFFPAAEDDPAMITCSSRAVRTGLRMQTAMASRFQPVQHEQLVALLGEGHQSSLTMSIGIARGKLFEVLVGNRTQRDHMIQGELPGLAMQAEGVGERDEVLIDRALAADLAAQFRIVPFDDEFSRVLDVEGKLDDYEFSLLGRRRPKPTALFDLEQSSLITSLERLATTAEVCSRYLAPNVLHELVNRDDFHLPSEHRRTVTLFVHATGFAELLSRWGDEQLQFVTALIDRYYNIVQRVVSKHGGTLARTDPYKLGTKLLITFGAPIAHADDPHRAVAAALEMRRLIETFNQALHEEFPAPMRQEGGYVFQRIGITQGDTYAGEVGWKQRREFTVMGDDVNLAARLMAHAQPGQVLISERVCTSVKGAFAVEPLEPLVLKGKRKTVQAYAVLQPSTDQRVTFDDDTPFVGHDMFMLSLKLALQQASRRRRRALALIGDAGIGKTRIAQQLARDAESSGFAVAWATSTPRNDRKTLWAALVAQLVGIYGERTPAARSTLRERLRALDLADLDGIFADLLFGYMPMAPTQPQAAPKPAAAVPADIFARVAAASPSELKTSGLFGNLRRASEKRDTGDLNAAPMWEKVEKRISLTDALARFFTRYCEQHPTLIVIDDAHHENAEALAVLRDVIAAVTQARLIVLATYEPIAGFALEMQPFVVPDLAQDETVQIAMAFLRVSELDGALSDLLWARSSGRPLFVEALLRNLHERSFLRVENGRASLAAEADLDAVPADVRSLVVSQIDRLDEDAGVVARIGAIFDQPFTAAEIGAVGDIPDSARVEHALAGLVSVQTLKAAHDDRYTFRHGFTRATLYDMLSRAQRVKYHRAAARHYERTEHAPSAVDAPVSAAYHLIRCGLLPQAIDLVIRKADAAEKAGQAGAAVELLTRSLILMPGEKTLEARLHTLQSELTTPHSP